MGINGYEKTCNSKKFSGIVNHNSNLVLSAAFDTSGNQCNGFTIFSVLGICPFHDVRAPGQRVCK